MHLYYHLIIRTIRTAIASLHLYPQEVYVHVPIDYFSFFLTYGFAARRFKPIAPALPNGLKDLTTKPQQTPPPTTPVPSGMYPAFFIVFSSCLNFPKSHRWLRPPSPAGVGHLAADVARRLCNRLTR